MVIVASVLSGGCSTPVPVEEHPCARGARPSSVDDAVATIQSLPSPVTLDCFLGSLERPLGLELTENTFSAQPAGGPESPRIFIMTDTLTMSIVPVGEGRDLLEFGERTASGLTTKAEIHFPVELPFDAASPFDRVHTPDGPTPTGCGVCHTSETDMGEGRWASTPLQPRQSTLVPIDLLLDENERCDPAEDVYRCTMLSALLDHGDVFHEPFPNDFLVLTPP